jgi:hypothetical protein
MDLSNVVTWTLAGTAVAVDLHDLNGVEWSAAKRALGWGWVSEVDIIERALRHRDLEAIAAIVWLWRRREDAALVYEDVLGSMTFARLAR